jgi:chromosomal replication initiator protein
MSKGLSSRLTSGLLTKIHGPDYTTRLKILDTKATEHQIKLSDEILHLLATRLQADVRQMESALNCMKAKSDLLKANIDLGMAKDVVNQLVSQEPSITPQKIATLVCTYYNLEPASLASKSRKKLYAYPRNIYAYLCRHHTHETLEEIGRTINRTHSSVLYASELVSRRMKSDPALKREVDFLTEKLQDSKG